MKKRLLPSAPLLPLLVLAAAAGLADTVNFEYDELGRLTRVQHGDGSEVAYALDPAGNRTQVTTTTPPAAPSSITVPSSSATGSYTISWGTASGTVTTYQLYEATNSNFSNQVQVHSGAATAKAISGKGNGTYYYRVRACNGSACGVYRTGGNVVSVTLVGIPPSISVPATSTTGSYTISWGTSSGTVTAYRLYEATNSSFSGQTLVHDGAATGKALSGKANGTYYYRVRACNASGCSAYRTSGNAVTVTIPPGLPASITVPSSSTTGSYSISWGAASGTVTAYKLYEATNSSFTGQTLVHNGIATSKALSGKGNGTYYYRVRACNGSACSGYRTGGNAVTVTLPPGVPASISVPSSSGTGNYTISWGTSSGTVTAYKLYEATNSSFSGQVQAYSGTGTSKAISGKSNGTYYYRVRACNGGSCSGYRSGGNATTVTLVPAPPASVSGPSQVNGGSYSITWSSSTGATRYELWESYFGGSFSKVYDGSNTFKGFNNKPAGEYVYKVKACNAGGCSAFSVTKFCMVCNPQCL
jgi:YD repeat-containing protein